MPWMPVLDYITISDISKLRGRICDLLKSILESCPITALFELERQKHIQRILRYYLSICDGNTAWKSQYADVSQVDTADDRS